MERVGTTTMPEKDQTWATAAGHGGARPGQNGDMGELGQAWER